MNTYSRLYHLLFLISLPLFIFAQSSKDNLNEVVSPSRYQAMEYRSIGPFRGGRVTAVTGIPDQPYTFFMGSTGGGVWRTDDGGNTWNNITDGYLKVGSIGSIEVAPSDPHIIYVGTGSASPRGNISLGNGMYKSMDGGKTWKQAKRRPT